MRPPFSWHRVETGDGPVLLLIALAQPALATGATLRLAEEDGPDAPSLNTLPIRPRDTIAALLGTTEPAVLLGVLRFITAKALGTLRRAEDSALAGTCQRLAADLSEPNRAAKPIARAGERLVLWHLPDAPRKRAGGAHVLIGSTRLARIPAAGRAVLLPAQQARAGAIVLPPEGGRPVRLLPPPPASSALPSLTELGRRTEPAARALHRDALAGLAAGDESARRLLRDLRLVGGAEPARACVAPEHPFSGALDMAIPDGAGGVFLRGWLRDPLGLVTGLTVRSPGGDGGDRPLHLSELHRFARPDLTETYADAPHGGAGSKPGFAMYLPDAGGLPGGQWSLRLSLSTGDTTHLVAPAGPAQPRAARDAVLGAVAPRHLTPELMRGCVAPATERLHRAAMALRETPDTLRIGAGGPPRPAVALVVPLYRNLRYLRHQYAAFARDSLLREAAELIYVLDSPDQREDVEHMLRGLHAVCGMPLTLVIQPANYGYASACNAGAAVAEGATLALVNSDVVPTARGWLEPLLRELDRLSSGGRVAAVGPKLLFEDGSLQHAGLFFEQGPGGEWFNSHYWKGYPRFHPPAQVGRLVPGVTGALLCLRRQVFESLGGLSTDYIVGDYEDSDLCLRLRAAGGEIAFVPEAELYHFERQSIRDHGGYTRTSACNYNRFLHHARWAPAIEALMARFSDAVAAMDEAA